MEMVRVSESTWINAALIVRVDIIEDRVVNYWTVSNHSNNPDQLTGDEAVNFINWLHDNDNDARPDDGTGAF